MKTKGEPSLGLPKGVDFAYARCCRPVPGDMIVGVIRTGKPVSIHRQNCRAYAHMDMENDRSIDIGWNRDMQLAPASARIAVMVNNQKGAIGSITTVIGQQDCNIVDISVGRRSNDVYELLIEVEVADLGKLLVLQAALRALPIVASVDRVQS